MFSMSCATRRHARSVPDPLRSCSVYIARHGTLLWICLAGAAGTGARYLIAIWAAQRLGSAFPYGTLIVNLAGCFVIAAMILLVWFYVTGFAFLVGGEINAQIEHAAARHGHPEAKAPGKKAISEEKKAA